MRVFGQRVRICPTIRADFLDRSGAGVDVRGPELGRQEMAAAEHIQRQVAVAIVIAVEEPAFLMAVQRVVGGVEVEDDLLGRPCVRLEEEVDEQRLDRRRVVADLVVAGGDLARQFQPVQRRFARHRRAILAPGFELARQHRHQRVVTKLVMIVQVLVAERDAEHALPDERGDRVLHEPRVSGVAETSRKPPNQISLRSAAPRSRPPASEVSAPPSNAATTGRPSTCPNTLGSALHSVCIGPLLRTGSSRSHKTTFA